MAAALGFAPHTGWAAAVVLAGPPERPEVLDRRRITLIADDFPDPRFAYHAAADAGLPVAEGVALVKRVFEEAVAQASAAVGELKAQHGITRAGAPEGSSPIPDDFERIMKTHALLHAAEGELFRDAIAEGAAAAGLAVVRAPVKALAARLGAAVGVPAAEAERQVAALGKGLGPPWSADQRQASAAAWLALLG